MDTYWFSESGVIDIFVMLGFRFKDVFKQYAVLIGFIEFFLVGGIFCIELWNQIQRDFITLNIEKSLKDDDLNNQLLFSEKLKLKVEI